MKLRNLFVSLLLTALGFTTAYAQSLVLRHRDGSATVVSVTDSLKLQTDGGTMSVISGTDKQTYNNDDILTITYRNGKSDVNRDFLTNISDVVTIINTMAGKAKEEEADGITDVNGDGRTDISDVVAVINVMAGKNQTPLPDVPDYDADFDSETGDAFYIFRNDGKFNAFLRADADSITFSKDKQLVHTPDSTFTIPLAAIDSVSFIMQKPVMQDGLFYLRDYHASHTTAIDSLTLYFDSAILADSLPNVGQVMINVTSTPPFDEGFVGRVLSVNRQNDRVKVECERAEIADVFKKLIVVGKVVSDDAEAPRRAVRRKDNSVPWVKKQVSDVITDIELDDMSLSVLDGLLSLKSKAPKLTCSYYVYIDEMFYTIAADVYISHPDLTFGINFKGKKFYEYANDVSEFLTEQIMGPTGVKWEKPALQKFMEDGLPIPILKDGFFNLTLRIAPQIKISGDMEVDWLSKTSGRQHIGFMTKGFTATKLASMSNPLFSLIPYNPLGSITDWEYKYVQDPLKTQQLKLKVGGGIKFGLLVQLEANLLSEKCVHASLGVEAGARADTTLDVSLYESDYPTMNLYETIKDSKLEVKDYVTIKGAIGATPFKFWELQGEADLYEKVYAQFYLLPHFTEPAFPRYENGRWVNDLRSLEQVQPLCLYSDVSKNLVFNCNIGMLIEDEKGKVVKEVKVADPYLDETVWAYSHSPLKIDVSGLEPGKTYTCYPTYCLIGSTYRKAYPYLRFTMAEPVSLSSTSLKLNPGDSRVLRIYGGWQQYKVAADNENVDVSQYKHEVNDSTVTDLHIEAGTIGTTVVNVTDIRSNETVTLTVEVTDEELPQDAVRVSVPTLDFESVEPGESKTMQFSVINERANPVTFIIENTSGEFEIAESGTDITLEPGDTRTFDVVFHSSLSGCEFSKEITVSFGEVVEPQKIMLTAKTGGTNPEQLRCTDENHPHIIDMGPAGKWACCNVGATAPWEPGGYFAWGETAEKTEYNLSTYEHCDGTAETCHDLGGDIAGTKYDVAFKTWGNGWLMPGEEQFKRLMNSCTSVWTNMNGMTGRLFTAPNGATLFLPAAGYRYNDALSGRDGGYYWSSVQCTDKMVNAYDAYLSERDMLWGYDYLRYFGMTVRPVYGTLHSLKISTTALDFGYVPAGTTKTLSFTVTNSTNKSISFTVTKTGDEFEIADCNGEITLAARQERTFEVTFSASKSDNNYTGEIDITTIDGNTKHIIDLSSSTSEIQTYLSCPDTNHPHIIDMGCYGKWSCCNVGATNPWEYGDAFAWGETEKTKISLYIEDCDWSSYRFCDGDEETCYNLGRDIKGTQYDVAHVKWGGKWCMPTNKQLGFLLNCSQEWTSVHNVAGVKFTAPNGGTIFLPLTPYLKNINPLVNETFAYYGSSSIDSDDMSCALILHFLSNQGEWWEPQYVRPWSIERCIGRCVRPVIEDSKVDEPTNPNSLCPDSNHPHVIDMGAGGKWACCNVGASAPWECGGYYAWGETKEKSCYDHDTYAYYDENSGSYLDIGEDISNTQYDVAHMKWGSNWHMPKDEQLQSLLDNCYSEWTSVNGKNGVKITSANGNIIFFPTAGQYVDEEIDDFNSGYYLSSSKSHRAYGFCGEQWSTWGPSLYYAGVKWDNWGFNMVSGKSVRPVFGNLPSLKLSTSIIDFGNVSVDSVKTMQFTITNRDKKNTTFTIMKTGNEFEIVDSEGEITLAPSEERTFNVSFLSNQLFKVFTGKIIISEKNSNNNDKQIILLKSTNIEPAVWEMLCPDINHPHIIDLGDAGKWSCCNIGATVPWKLGDSYAWGETEVKDDYTWQNYKYDFEMCPDIAGTQFDVAHVKWGGNWRMPSQEDFLQFKNCKRKWTSINGVNGSKISAPNGNSIFLPAAGEEGNYWTSTQGKHYENSWSGWNVESASKYAGYQVRPILSDIEIQDPAISDGLCPDVNHPHIIDMGEVGKWSCCNIGANAPWEKGGYYAWGETEEKTNYDFSTYIHSDGNGNYNDIGSDIAGTQYDVAHVKWGDYWCLPKHERINLLINKCSIEVGFVNGIKGTLFTAPNGNSIFLPTVNSYYCSSTVCTDNKNVYCFGYDRYNEIMNADDRSRAWNVRAVYEGIPNLQISTDNLDFGFVPAGNSKTMQFTVSNLGTKTASFSIVSSSDAFEIADCNGDISLAPHEERSFNVTFSSNETNQVFSDEIIITKGDYDKCVITVKASTKIEKQLLCPNENHPHIIDMGEAGKWACCNVGASAPWEYGSYYAWGETEEKDNYSWETYIHCDGSSDTCHDLGEDISGTKWDVAHVKWGGKWHMPDQEQLDLLINNCSNEWTTINGVNGRYFYASNGGVIFLPASGSHWEGYPSNVGNSGTYWSSTQCWLNEAYCINFYDYESELYSWCTYNQEGYSVRPVFSDVLTPVISTDSIAFGYLPEGYENTIPFTVTNIDTKDITINLVLNSDGFWIDDYYDEEITLTPSEERTFNVSFYANQSDQIYSGKIIIKCKGAIDRPTIVLSASSILPETPVHSLCPDDNHPHVIDMGIAGKWACCNVGANAPWEYGGYYAWGETEEKDNYSWETYIHCDGSQESCHDIVKDITGTEYDVAHVKWGGNWRMPSINDQYLLLENCTSEWTSVNGIKGRKFSAPNGAIIFLPAAGLRWNDGTYFVGSSGYFWSSTQNPDYSYYAYYLYFGSGDTYWSYDGRYYGLSVRPVTE